MKPIIAMTVFLLFSSSLILSANAGTVTTTTVTTVKTVKQTNCHKKYKTYKRHHYYTRGCSSYYGCSYYDESYYNRCPGGAWDCYYDLHGRHFQQEDISEGVSYGHQVKFKCLESEDPASCS